MTERLLFHPREDMSTSNRERKTDERAKINGVQPHLRKEKENLKLRQRDQPYKEKEHFFD